MLVKIMEIYNKQSLSLKELYKMLSTDERVLFLEALDCFLASCRKLKLISEKCDLETWDKISRYPA